MSLIKVQSDNLCSPSGSPFSSTAHFASTTSGGNLLICLVSATSDTAGSGGVTPVITAPTTPGFTWILAAAETSDPFYFPVPTDQTVVNAVAVYYIENAASMGTGTLTTCGCNLDDDGFNSFIFDLVEISGAATSGVLDATAVAKGTTPSTSAGTIVTTHTDLILVAAGVTPDPGTVASGYTALDFTDLDTFGVFQAEYQLNASPGSYATSFTSGNTDAYPWAAVAVAFAVAESGSSITLTFANDADTGSYYVN